MTANAIRMTTALLVIYSVTTALASTHSKHPDDTQLRACRDAIAFHSDFKKLPMAAFSVYPGTHKHGNVDWSVAWEGRQANGSCKVTGKGKIEHFKVRYDSSPRHKQTHHDDKETGGFYYDRHSAKWRDPSGAICHTCTPQNGFPDHRHADKKWKPDNHLEREMVRQMERQLSEQDIKNINNMYSHQ